MTDIINFQAKSLRTLVDPVLGKNNNQNKESWICYVNLNDIPKELADWMKVNRREQNLKTSVSKQILESIEDSKNFHDLNRGMVILVEELKGVKIDDNNYDVKITLTDQAKHGLVDGGHTFKCILNKREEYLESNSKLELNFVMLQIFQGIEDVVDLAGARNTSSEVDMKSIMELENKFDDVKNIIENSKYKFLKKRLTFKQFQKFTDPIDSREIIALLSLFHPKINTQYNQKGEFIQVYTSKAYILNEYLKMINNVKNTNEIKKMAEVLPKIIELWEKIEFSIPKITGKSKYKLKKYSNSKKDDNDKWEKRNKTLFERTSTESAVPKGLIYPVIAAFAQLIEFDKNSDQYKFEVDRMLVWENTSKAIVTKLMESSRRNGDSPNAIGKDVALWDSIFKEILIDVRITNVNKYSKISSEELFKSRLEISQNKQLESDDK